MKVSLSVYHNKKKKLFTWNHFRILIRYFYCKWMNDEELGNADPNCFDTLCDIVVQPRYNISTQPSVSIRYDIFGIYYRPGSVPIHLLHTSLTRLCLSNGEAKTMLFYVVLVNTKARTKAKNRNKIWKQVVNKGRTEEGIRFSTLPHTVRNAAILSVLHRFFCIRATSWALQWPLG